MLLMSSQGKSKSVQFNLKLQGTFDEAKSHLAEKARASLSDGSSRLAKKAKASPVSGQIRVWLRNTVQEYTSMNFLL